MFIMRHLTYKLRHDFKMAATLDFGLFPKHLETVTIVQK